MKDLFHDDSTHYAEEPKFQIVECDKCKSRKGPHVHLSHAVERYTDAAGASDTHHVSADLCYECAFSQLKAFVAHITEMEAVTFYKSLGVQVRDHQGRPL